MGNIHDIFKDDDVNGVIVGSYYTRARLFYDGRPQGKVHYALSDDEAITACKDALSKIKSECGEAFLMIYPKTQAWEIRVYY